MTKCFHYHQVNEKLKWRWGDREKKGTRSILVENLNWSLIFSQFSGYILNAAAGLKQLTTPVRRLPGYVHLFL